MRYIEILDTTLRDGEQTPGVRFSLSHKTEIAKQLERLGVDAIEAGFPASSKGDFEAVSAISREVRGCSVQALARCTKSDIDTAAEALKDAVDPIIHVFIATSPVHLQYKLKITENECLERINEAVRYAKSLCKTVQFSPEDATRSERDFLCLAVKTAVDAGADIINIPDTVGYAVPEEFAELVSYVIKNVPSVRDKKISVHCHNDLGLAVANSITAVSAGATRVECAVNGIGERAGNASLEEVVMALRVRKDFCGCDTKVISRELLRTSRMVSSLAGYDISLNKAIVGQNAFAHESGIHQHGMMEHRETYEIMKPEEIGADKSTMILGKLSGRHAYSERLTTLGYALDTKGIDATFNRFKEIANKKVAVTDSDIRAIVNEYLDGIEGKYWIDTFQIQSGNHMKAMALVSLKAGDEVFTESAPGEGPIDAAFNTINRIAKADDVHLESYNLKAVTEGADALGEVKVKISSDRGAFTGRGVSTDVIKASIKAYVNAINKWARAKG
ncbi:MAG: 2-isopropylmalate synthase [Clostridia bacterium]|nr:2-isopropylmalate synthase [Clostridia bacterium]